MKTINLGCGDETVGDVRVDFVETPTTTHICNLNKQLPFQDNSFDAVHSKSVLEHIRNLDCFISEIKRILKPNGTFWIRTDNASYIPFHLRNHQHYIEGTYKHHTSEDKHYYLYKEEHLKNLFSEFRNLQVKFTCPSKKLFFIPTKFKCMHIEIEGIK